MTFPEDIHVEIIRFDDRHRARLGRWVSKDPSIVGWKVFVSNGGKTIRLEALEAEA